MSRTRHRRPPKGRLARLRGCWCTLCQFWADTASNRRRAAEMRADDRHRSEMQAVQPDDPRWAR